MPSGIPPAILENEAKKMKRYVEGWREVLLPLHSLLTWQTPGAAGIIFGAVTSFFLVMWYMDPTVLTAVSTIGLIVILLDYFVPVLTVQFVRSDAWTASKEKELEKICKALTSQKLVAARGIKSFAAMRGDRPKIFYLIAISLLIFLTWLGSVINNLLLTYFFVLAILMCPGLKEKGILAPMLQNIRKIITSVGTKEVKTE